ncbi:MAG: metal ABC transporter permease [Syntrophorhabdaceae bacterium]|nr:metal ABC transporter permease [Syntrophorhabdaceae bacterium]
MFQNKLYIGIASFFLLFGQSAFAADTASEARIKALEEKIEKLEKMLPQAIPTAIFGKWFYLFFALFVTVSVQIAGVYLVFATLVFPAVGVYYITLYKNKLLWGYLGSFLGLVGALLFALVFDLSSGPTIVWGIVIAMTAVFIGKSKSEKLEESKAFHS